MSVKFSLCVTEFTSYNLLLSLIEHLYNHSISINKEELQSFIVKRITKRSE